MWCGCGWGERDPAQALVGTALKVLKTFNDLKSQYKSAELKIASMKAQCACVELGLFQVQSIIVENLDSSLRLRTDPTVARTFDSVFGAYHLAFMLLNERLMAIVEDERNESEELNKAAKMKNVWNG